MTILLKRVYEPAEPNDGYRILVDRLWPRGVSKSLAHIDSWPKEIAPSTALRKWFGHDPLKWTEFRDRYLEELHRNAEVAAQLIDHDMHHGVVTLVYSAKDMKHNHAIVLKEYLESLKLK